MQVCLLYVVPEKFDAFSVAEFNLEFSAILFLGFWNNNDCIALGVKDFIYFLRALFWLKLLKKVLQFFDLHKVINQISNGWNAKCVKYGKSEIIVLPDV